MSERWVRTNRATDIDLDTGFGIDRVAGPWHRVHDMTTGQTWCGKHPGRLVSSERAATVGDAVPEGRLCSDCVKAHGTGRPKPYRRH